MVGQMLGSKPDLAGFRSLRESGLWSKVRLFKVPLPIAVALCLGAGLSVAAFFLVLSLQKTNTVKAFEGPAQEYAISISKDLDGHLEVVKSAGAFFNASNEIDRWQFFQFARDALPRHPGIQAIEWVPRVPDKLRTVYEDRAQTDGLFGFRFIELTGEGLDGNDGRIEAEPRTEHFPIFFVEPFIGNESDLGRDLATSGGQLATLLRSRNSGRMVVAPQREPAGPPDQAELVVLQPVYAAKSVPESKAERIESLLGFARGVLRLGSLAYSVRPAITGLGGLDVYIFKRDGAARELLHYLPQSSDASTGEPAGYGNLVSGLHVERDHVIADQTWSIVIAPSRNWQSEATRFDAWLVLVLGLLLTAMLLQHLIASRNRTRAIERAVVLRTTELREANSALKLEIHERKRAEQEMRAAKEKAEEASRAKSDFLAMIGHELRTPLNAINGFSEIMANEMFGPVGDRRYRDYVEQINISGNHLLCVINDILDLTKLESDSFDLDNDTLAIGEVVSEVCNAAQAKTVEAGLDMTISVARDTPFLMASHQAVRRILDHLLSNAIKFTPTGGRITVNCGTAPSGGVVIEVGDNGTGIAPDAQNRIFQPFAQSDQSLSRPYEGTGLGLALTLRLVELHGGALELDSQIGEGTTVRVIFPAERSLHSSEVKELTRSKTG